MRLYRLIQLICWTEPTLFDQSDEVVVIFVNREIAEVRSLGDISFQSTEKIILSVRLHHLIQKALDLYELSNEDYLQLVEQKLATQYRLNRYALRFILRIHPPSAHEAIQALNELRAWAETRLDSSLFKTYFDN